jgi:hypothetical protein
MWISRDVVCVHVRVMSPLRGSIPENPEAGDMIIKNIIPIPQNPEAGDMIIKNIIPIPQNPEAGDMIIKNIIPIPENPEAVTL